MAEALLKIRGLHLAGGGARPEELLCGVSLEVERGRTFVLLGESGCGKTLTSLAVMRLLPPGLGIRSGSIRLDGVELLQLTERAMRAVRGRRIGMIFQDPQTSLNPVLSVGSQIDEVLRLRGVRGRAERRRRAVTLLDEVGIPDAARRVHEYPHQLSGGMKQRVMIAIALAGEPELLICDEPSTALDVTIQAQVLKLLRTLQERKHMAMLFITHDLGVAYRMAHRVGVMRFGRLVETAERDAFFDRPRHDYSRQLFADLPRRLPPRDMLPEPAADPAKKHPTLLEVRNLKIHFPIRKGALRRVVGQVKAVDGVSLDLRAGETLALVGESGCGKTTLGRGILQLEPCPAGSVHFDGVDLGTLSGARLRRRRRDFQIVFQDPFASMNPRMIISDIVEEGMLAQGLGGNREERLQRVEELLCQVELEAGHRSRYPHEFSGGQRQRICIARALAVEPRLLICDEPTSSLDMSVQAQILRLLLKLQEQRGLAYLFITHNLELVRCLAHHVAVMYRGCIVEHGPTARVMDTPQHAYTRELLSAVPIIGGAWVTTPPPAPPPGPGHPRPPTA